MSMLMFHCTYRIYICLFLYFVGQTPMDIAGAYADPRVYMAVKAKWDTLPNMGDKKKGGKGKGSPKAKRPTTGLGSSQVD